MEKINTVVVGYGGMGKYHADNIEKFENFNLVGIYDIKEEIQHGFSLFIDSCLFS